MSSTGLQRRPSLWSYFSFTSTLSRRQSVSLPTRNTVDDPYEKAGRHSAAVSSHGSARYMNASKSSWLTPAQRSRCFTIGGLIGLVLIMLIFVGPKDATVRRYVAQHRPGRGGQRTTDPAIGPTKCQTSSDPSKPLIQYALMIDAGSTGSRIHVYRFNNCGPTPELEDEVFQMTAKKTGGSGLSSYPDDPDAAAQSLDPLMEIAVKTVPDSLKACTPVAVKATAGLRLLGPDRSQKILDAVRHRLETVYPFSVLSRERGGVEIMDGKDEGVYAWITTNYLLGKIGGPATTPTAAVFDLGGGSTQIVFQPTFKSPSGGLPPKMAEGDHKYALKFGGRDFTLYQHSHLGYGLMAAREAIHRAVVEAAAKAHAASPSPSAAADDRAWLRQDVVNPCIAPQMRREVTVKLGPGHALGESVTVTMVGPAEGSPAQCRALAENILKKEAQCSLAPCSFGGVHQPSLEQTFAREDVYIFSYFYDRTKPLGMPDSFTVRELKDLTAQVCAGERAWAVFASVDGALPDLRGRPEWCLDLSFMTALLHTGYEMPLDREVKIAKKIKGNELGWCLGASLPLLSKESGWQCRVREVT
ncbi:MAG: Guanosine-diphosphatase [Phylliscum demangeonii]|nr:MAG: Guanosine-diphosphatase [Phylliscum demangeonii]